MNRREALRLAVLATAGVAIGAQASDKPQSYLNRIEMKPKDPKNMTKGELKHTPSVLIKSRDSKGYSVVEVSVGQANIIHPSTPDHWIDFISLYADGKLVGKNILEAEISRGFSSFAVKLDGVKSITAKAGCNLHGIWSTTIAT